MSPHAKLEASPKKQAQPKGESITIRVSPKIKWGVELLSRKQHRSITSVVEWALDKALNDNHEGLSDYDNFGNVVFNILEDTWEPLEPDRFVKLAIKYPKLLTYEEELVWRVVRETGYFWRGQWERDQWAWSIGLKDMIWDRLRSEWDKVNKVAIGEADKSILPKVDKSANDNFIKEPAFNAEYDTPF